MAPLPTNAGKFCFSRSEKLIYAHIGEGFLESSFRSASDKPESGFDHGFHPAIQRSAAGR